MTMRTAPMEDDGLYRPLRCPRCGNHGQSSFNADTFVLIGGDGVPTLVGSYVEVPDVVIDCHGCDHKGPLEDFTQRHRPGDRARHHRADDSQESAHA